MTPLSVRLTTRLATIAFVSMVLPGCSPLISMAGAVLSSLTDEAAVAPRVGPFAGVPTRAQNGANPDPAPRQAMNMDREINPLCRAKLPPPEPPSLVCVLRPVCLPGSTVPVTLRLCPDPNHVAAAMSAAK